MSDNWKVVERNRKQRVRPGATNSNNIAENGIHQVKENHKENEKIIKNDKPKEKPKVEKPKMEPEPKKKIEVEKVKHPKSLEQAMMKINLEELRQTCNSVALSDVARFLNSQLYVDQNDETYSKLPIGYPLTIVPSIYKSVIEKAIIEESKRSSVHFCLEFCLSYIAHNMMKGQQVAGYKLMIQFIAEFDPKLFIECIPKFSNLMGSYQNCPPIGLSLLWSIGQGGFRNFSVGVEVWKKAMLPLMELRHYSKFVINYLVTLLSKSNLKSTIIKPMDFLELFNYIHSEKPQKEHDKLIREQSPILRELYFKKTASWKKFNFMDKLLDYLPNTYTKEQTQDFKKKEVLNCIIDALESDVANFDVWKNSHIKYTKQSSHILYYIEKDWKAISFKVNNTKLLQCINHFKNTYQELINMKKKDADLEVVLQCCENIMKKTSKAQQQQQQKQQQQAKTKRGGFPWVKGIFVLLIAIAVALSVYDVSQAGSFEKSQTGKFTKIGIEHSHCALSKTLAVSARGYKYLEKNAPPYFVAFSQSAKPYGELLRDLAIIVLNQVQQFYTLTKEYLEEKWPIVYTTIDGYAPGFLKAVQEYSSASWSTVKRFLIQYYDITQSYLKTKVFIDNWAPEVLHAKLSQALNTTQLHAADYYKWFYKHVDDYSKL